MRALMSIAVCALFIIMPASHAQEDELGGNLDSLEVRPSLVQPRLSLPTKLAKVFVASPGEYFAPPLVSEIPDDEYGEVVRWGRNIFVDTQKYAKRYVGNGLNCSSCHLQEGRKPDAGPLWGAYGMYPKYRLKNRQVVTFEERIQDCFRYSMDGIAPTLDAPEMEALMTYAHWLSKGAPTGVKLPGAGFPVVNKSQSPSAARGKIIYENRCAICHGKDGLGQKFVDQPGYMFPPLWGSDSFNKGAGMSKIRTLSQFIKANMPLGQGFSLTDQEAVDVATYIQIQDRPKNPRVSFIMDFLFPNMGGR